ncbi:MAG TPA: hypothetical protein VKD47_06150 [Miltoncostaeaceae bacterium]|nr:hypothetical protein [Miltoncostaeaceae bacterium]
MPLLAEPASALTDLGLGVVALGMAAAIPSGPPPRAHWRRLFLWTGIAAVAGFVHHGVLTRYPSVDGASWAVVTLMVVVAISYLLAATVAEVLGPGRAKAFWGLRSGSFIAYGIVALLGHAGIAAMLSCEGVTMAAVLALWGLALQRGHPRGLPIVAALVASMIAASLRAMPADLVAPTGLDPTSLYHLAQIPALVALFVAAGLAGETALRTDPLALIRRA